MLDEQPVAIVAEEQSRNAALPVSATALKIDPTN
jgi:hypothetical protein